LNKNILHQRHWEYISFSLLIQLSTFSIKLVFLTHIGNIILQSYLNVLGFIFPNVIKASIRLLTSTSYQKDNLFKVVQHKKNPCGSIVCPPSLQHSSSTLNLIKTFGNWSNNYHIVVQRSLDPRWGQSWFWT
jgi:hypothetical protein